MRAESPPSATPIRAMVASARSTSCSAARAPEYEIVTSPAPEALHREVPALAAAVEALFEQVRSTLDNAHALALYDPVTALPNRIHFRREAERILKACGPGEGAALLFIDLDGFKEVNDR